MSIINADVAPSPLTTETATAISIREREFVEHVERVLERVHLEGARFLIERDGQAFALIAPPSKENLTLAELSAALAEVPPLDSDYAADIAAARRVVEPAEFPRWPE